MAAILSR